MTWDCIVVGGGAAGLSAGLVLGRARRRTLIIDKGEPSNRFAHGIGGLLGQDGRAPQDFYADGRKELSEVPERRVPPRRGHRAARPGFTLTLADGTTETAQAIVLATGMDYVYPDVPGVAERWGTTAFHCPFCHGWEVQDRPLFVLDPTEFGPDRAKLLSAWSDDVTLLTENPLRAARRRDRPRRRHDAPVRRAADRRPALPALRPRRASSASRRASRTRCSRTASPIDERFGTNVPGVFAAGDLTGTPPSVASAVASGSMAAAMAVHALVLAH